MNKQRVDQIRKAAVPEAVTLADLPIIERQQIMIANAVLLLGSLIAQAERVLNCKVDHPKLTNTRTTLVYTEEFEELREVVDNVVTKDYIGRVYGTDWTIEEIKGVWDDLRLIKQKRMEENAKES